MLYSMVNPHLTTLLLILLSLACSLYPNSAHAFENITYVKDIQGGLQEPIDVAIAADRDIFVLDKETGKVFGFDSTGKPKVDFGGRGAGPGQFDDPESLAVLPNGHLLVADTGNNRIQAFEPSGKFLFQFGSSGKLPGEFDSPTGIAIDQFGLVFVADQDNHRVQAFSEHGIFLRMFSFKGKPKDLAIDPQRNLYVLFPDESKVIKVSSNRQHQESLPNIAGALDFLDSASSIVADMRGDIYITEQSDESIKKLDASGRILLTFGSDGDGRGQFDEPSGIGVDPDGHIFIADSDNHRVQMLQVTGSKKASMPVVIQSPPIIEFERFVTAEEGITDLAYSHHHGLYLLSHEKDRIVHIGSTTQVFGRGGSQPGQFDEPQALALTTDGSLLVADTGNDRVQILQADGTPSYQFGQGGDKTGQFDEPQGIAMGNNDLVYVADTDNHRIQIFNKDTIFLSSFGKRSEDITSRTPEYGKFNEPTALATNSRNDVYVLDSQNHRIQQFTEEGKFIRQIGSEGKNPGQFFDPVDIAVDEEDYLYVADQGNNRVQIFNPEGALVFLFGASASREMFGIDISFGATPQSQPGKFSKVSGITIGKGKLYVADYKSKNVQMFRFYPSGLIKEERLFVIKSIFPPQESDKDPFLVAKKAAIRQAFKEIREKTGLSETDLQDVAKVESIETLSTGAVQVTISVPKNLLRKGPPSTSTQPKQEKSPESDEFILQ